MTDLAAPPHAQPINIVEPTIQLTGVSKRFGEIQALESLDLTVETGAITVLLGPNGAGKTTAIRLMTGTLPPDEGSAMAFGLDPFVEGESVRQRCGVVSAKPSLYDRLSGLENLRYAAALYGVDDNDVRLRHAAERFAIDDALHLAVGGYSTGMKTRLALARAILHEPDLLLLDEPTSGLDPESSQAVLALIRELTDGGRTVVMCTHLLAEAEGLADHVVMLEAGRNLLSGTQEELISRYWKRSAVTLDAIGGLTIDSVNSLGYSGVKTDDGIRIEIDTPEATAALVRDLVDSGIDIVKVDPERPTLEDLYFRVRGDRALGIDPMEST